MKTTTSRIFKLSCIFVIGSCEKEERLNAQKVGQASYVSKIIPSNKIGTNQKLVDLFPEQTNNARKKPLEENDNGILFDTNFARYFEYGNYHSYTFPVVNTPEGGGLENVVFALRENGNYSIFLVHYDLTEAQIKALAKHEYIEINPEAVTTTTLGPDYVPVSEIGAGPCGYIVFMWCSYGNHERGMEGDGGYCPGHEEMVIPLDCGGGTWTVPGNPNPPPTPGEIDDWHEKGNGSNDPDRPYTGTTLPIDYISRIENCIPPIVGEDNSWWGWLNADEDNDGNPDNFLAMRDLSKFLTDNECSEEAAAFGKAAAQALMNGGEVDFEERIFELFEDTDTDCVHDNLKEIDPQNPQITLYHELLTHFNDATDNWLFFEIGNTTGGNWGETSGSWLNPSNNGNFPDTYTITISNDIDQNGSNLAKMVTLCHELTHAYMFDTLSDAGYITFDSTTGEPIITQTELNNLSCNIQPQPVSIFLNSYSDAGRFAILMCAMIENGLAQSTDWSHALFGSSAFSVNTYQQQLEDFIYNNHDWNNENPILVLLLQSEFGNDWKSKAAEYISWRGLEQTQAFEDWANANNVDYTINSDGTMGGIYNSIISTIKSSGNSNCN